MPRTPYNITNVLWDLIPQYRDRCAIRCPNPQYGDDFWRGISIVFFVVCLLSLLCSCFTVVAFIVYPERRKFPSILILHLTIACIVAAVGGMLTLFDHGDVKRVICANEFQYASFGHPRLCTAQSLIFMFGDAAQLFWWLAIILNLLALIVFRINLQKYYWAIVAFGWVPPFVFMFTAVGLRDAVPGVSWPFCLPSSDGLLYYPIGAVGSLGLLCTLITIVAIVMITVRGNSGAKWQTLVAPVVRSVLLGLIIVVPYAVVLSYRFTNHPSTQLTQVGDYLLCIIQGLGNCGTVPRTSPAFNYVLSVSLGCVGILTWACYSTHWKYFVDLRHWVLTRGRVTRTADTSSRALADHSPSTSAF